MEKTNSKAFLFEIIFVSEFKLKCDFSRNFNVYAVNIMNMIIKCCSNIIITIMIITIDKTIINLHIQV